MQRHLIFIIILSFVVVTVISCSKGSDREKEAAHSQTEDIMKDYTKPEPKKKAPYLWEMKDVTNSSR